MTDINPQGDLPLPNLPKREDDTHKGDYGFALIVGGSRGMAGAVALVGIAALRGGAGLVRLAVPDRVLETVAALEPSYATIALPDDQDGRIGGNAYERIVEAADWADVVAIGPGLGRSDELDAMVGRLYRELNKPLVLDADALNALATQPEILPQPGGPRILTPHPGEFARLVGKKQSLAEREEAASQLAARCGVVLVLKSHHTLTTDGRRSTHNTTGNPGMATGGSGDVLTGLIGALLGQGLEPFDAARLGVHLHGLAGDIAAEELGQRSMIASDLVEYLSDAFDDFGG